MPTDATDTHPMTDGEHDPDAVGRRVLEQLTALGVTAEDLDTPADVDPAAVMAWLDGRAPCPVPR